MRTLPATKGGGPPGTTAGLANGMRLEAVEVFPRVRGTVSLASQNSLEESGRGVAFPRGFSGPQPCYCSGTRVAEGADARPAALLTAFPPALDSCGDARRKAEALRSGRYRVERRTEGRRVCSRFPQADRAPAPRVVSHPLRPRADLCFHGAFPWPRQAVQSRSHTEVSRLTF